MCVDDRTPFRVRLVRSEFQVDTVNAKLGVHLIGCTAGFMVTCPYLSPSAGRRTRREALRIDLEPLFIVLRHPMQDAEVWFIGIQGTLGRITSVDVLTPMHEVVFAHLRA